MEIIRYESPFDYAEIFKLWENIFGHSEALLEELQVNGSESQYNKDFVYAAKENNTLLGVVHTTIPVDFPTLGGLAGVCTTPEARGKGVGKLLLSKAVSELDAMGVKTAFLGTGNMIAANLYRSNGFNFFPGTYIMFRQTSETLADLTKWKTPEKIQITDGNQSFRIPIIPLVLNSIESFVINDINTDIIASPFALHRCMSLYPQYLQLKENGGHYFGAISECKTLGAIASVMQTEIGNRCDFFWGDHFDAVIPEMIEKCRNIVGDVYLQIADNCTAKIKLAEDLGYSPCESVEYIHNNCTILTKIYRKG